jgi:hypothetical protein
MILFQQPDVALEQSQCFRIRERVPKAVLDPRNQRTDYIAQERYPVTFGQRIGREPHHREIIRGGGHRVPDEQHHSALCGDMQGDDIARSTSIATRKL